jgi:hypothetical protein
MPILYPSRFEEVYPTCFGGSRGPLRLRYSAVAAKMNRPSSSRRIPHLLLQSVFLASQSPRQHVPTPFSRKDVRVRFLAPNP